MRCIMVNIRYLVNLIILLFFISFPSLAEEIKKPIAKGVIISSCITLDSITQLANLDKESQPEAEMLFNYFRMNGKCGSYSMLVPVFLEKLEFSYTDTNGTNIDVWKLHNQEMWSLIQTSLVKRLGLTL